MNGKIVIELPFPDWGLSPNARKHYQAKGLLAKAHRHSARIVTQAKYNPPDMFGRLVCVREFHEPDKRMRDIDNMGAACKAYQDGIFDALELNDKYIVEVRNCRREPRGEGFVVFTIFEEGVSDDN